MASSGTCPAPFPSRSFALGLWEHQFHSKACFTDSPPPHQLSEKSPTLSFLLLLLCLFVLKQVFLTQQGWLQTHHHPASASWNGEITESQWKKTEITCLPLYLVRFLKIHQEFQEPFRSLSPSYLACFSAFKAVSLLSRAG